MGVSTDAILGWGYCWSEDGLPGDLYEKYDSIWELIEKIREAYGDDIEIGTHCSGECPVLYIASIFFMAWRGYPVVGEDLDTPAPGKNKQDLLKKILKQFDLEEPHEQSWFLCSNWD